MAIEVRELIIRSSTSGKRASDDDAGGRGVELEQFREEILEACRRMLRDAQRREQER